MEIRWVEQVLVRDLEALKRELAAFPDEASLWATPPGIINAAGTLALHVAGNLRHFVGGTLGRSGYQRDRDREFAARAVPRADLLKELDQTIAAVRLALGPDVAIDPAARYPEVVGGKFTVVTGDWLVHLAAHLAFHLGQVGYLRRVVTGDPTSVGGVAITGLATAVRVPDPA